MNNKSITFNNEEHNNLPQEIKDRMKADREAASNHQDKGLNIGSVSFSLRDKFAIAAMTGELAAQNYELGMHWANEKDLAQRSYLIADAMMKERSNES